MGVFGWVCVDANWFPMHFLCLVSEKIQLSFFLFQFGWSLFLGKLKSLTLLVDLVRLGLVWLAAWLANSSRLLWHFFREPKILDSAANKLCTWCDITKRRIKKTNFLVQCYWLMHRLNIEHRSGLPSLFFFPLCFVLYLPVFKNQSSFDIVPCQLFD